MDNLILVNRENGLDENYVPSDLVISDENENNFHNYVDASLKPMVRKEVLEMFQILREAALEKGFDIIIDSGYRSYQYQQDVWDQNKEKNLELLKKEKPYLSDKELDEEAKILTDKYVAYPGHSEHQTGLAFDFAIMKDGVYIEDFSDTDNESIWMKDNAYKYGFILRYPKGKENITGYKYEYWHYRYIGLPYSIECYENDLTLEEYHGLVLKR